MIRNRLMIRNQLKRGLVAATALSALTFGGCNKGQDGEAAPGQTAPGKAAPGKASAPTAAAAATLALIPADTPYAFVNTEPLPKEAMDKILGLLEPLTKQLDEELAKVLAEPASEDPQEKIGRALAEELKGKLNRAGLESMGIDTQPIFAIYGLGVLPVARVSLKDPAALKAMIDRVAQKSGQTPPTAKLGAQEYYKLSKDGVTIAVAFVGKELVITGGPDAVAPKLLPIAFGQTPPAQSLASSNVLSQINQAHGFLGYGTGLIDLVILADMVLGDAKGLNQEIWTALEAPTPPLDATCKAEIKALVAKSPRGVFGYTALTANNWNAKYVFELDGALAKELAGLTAKLPGTQADKPLAQFGFGLDVGKTLAFAKAKLAAMQAAPFKCGEFGELNAGITQAAETLGQPMPPVVNGLRGLRVVLESGEFGDGQPKNLKAWALFAAEGAPELVAMAKGMIPPLASLNLNPDSKPVAAPAGLIPPVVENPHLALSANALAFSVGAGLESKLPGLLGAAPTDSPIFYFGYDVGRFMKIIETASPMAEDEKKILNALGGFMGYTSYSMSFTAKGIELHQAMRLN